VRGNGGAFVVVWPQARVRERERGRCLAIPFFSMPGRRAARLSSLGRQPPGDNATSWPHETPQSERSGLDARGLASKACGGALVRGPAGANLGFGSLRLASSLKSAWFSNAPLSLSLSSTKNRIHAHTHAAPSLSPHRVLLPTKEAAAALSLVRPHHNTAQEEKTTQTQMAASMRAQRAAAGRMAGKQMVRLELVMAHPARQLNARGGGWTGANPRNNSYLQIFFLWPPRPSLSLAPWGCSLTSGPPP
jgi:hypothetical protein